MKTKSLFYPVIYLQNWTITMAGINFALVGDLITWQDYFFYGFKWLTYVLRIELSNHPYKSVQFAIL